MKFELTGMAIAIALLATQATASDINKAKRALDKSYSSALNAMEAISCEDFTKTAGNPALFSPMVSFILGRVSDTSANAANPLSTLFEHCYMNKEDNFVETVDRFVAGDLR